MVASNTTSSCYTSDSKQDSLGNGDSSLCSSSPDTSSSDHPRLGKFHERRECQSSVQQPVSDLFGESNRYGERELLRRFAPSSAFSFSTLSLAAVSGNRVSGTSSSSVSPLLRGPKNSVSRGVGRSVFSRLIVRGRGAASQKGLVAATGLMNSISPGILSREDLRG